MSGVTATRKMNVPKHPAALTAAARRVATGLARAGDAAKVLRAVPGYDAEFAARVIVLRGLWHRNESAKEWYG